MRVLWRPRALALSALLVSAPRLFPSGNAFAQSSLGAPLNGATGRSQADAVNQNEQELLGREVLGARPPGAAPPLVLAEPPASTFSHRQSARIRS